MPKAHKSSEFAGTSFEEKDAGFNERSQVMPALLSAQEYEAKASNDDHEPEFEVLTAMQELVPCPQALREGHGDELNGHDREENAAETHRGLRTLKQCAKASPRD